MSIRLRLLALLLLFAGLMSMPIPAVLAQGAAPPLIAWLRLADPDRPSGAPLRRALEQGGLKEGRDFRLVVWIAGGDPARMPAVATEAIAANPAIIVAFGPDAVRAARSGTQTIPIVAASALSEEGTVRNFARPEGNLTGVNMFVGELAPKMLEVGHEILPDLRHFGVLNDRSTNVPSRAQALREAARLFGLTLTQEDVRLPAEFAPAIQRLKAAGAEALLVNSSTLFATNRHELGRAALEAGLPAICQWREMVEAGCLASYGFPLSELHALVAMQVMRLLRGEKPEAIPIIQPLRFEFVLSRQVATRFGLSLPPAVLLRADEVIE